MRFASTFRGTGIPAVECLGVERAAAGAPEFRASADPSGRSSFPANLLLNWRHYLRLPPPEPLEVKLPDELPERQFPRFLLVVVQLAQSSGVHPQLTGHLHLGVRQVVTLPRLDPILYFALQGRAPSLRS
jgi:hypothetical protein